VFDDVYIWCRFNLTSKSLHFNMFSNKPYLILHAKEFSVLFKLTVALSVLARTQKSVHYSYCTPTYIYFARCSAFPSQSLEQIAEAHSPDLWLEYMEFGYCDSHLSTSVSFYCLPSIGCWINTGTVREIACNVTEQMMDNVAINPVLLGLNICATGKKLQRVYFTVMTENFNVLFTLLMFVPESGIWLSLLLVIHICTHLSLFKVRNRNPLPKQENKEKHGKTSICIFRSETFTPESMWLHVPLHDTNITIP